MRESAIHGNAASCFMIASVWLAMLGLIGFLKFATTRLSSSSRLPNGTPFMVASTRRATFSKERALVSFSASASIIKSSDAAYIASALAGLSWMTPRLDIGIPVSPANCAASERR